MKKSSTATCKNKEEKDGLQSLIQQYAETTDFAEPIKVPP
ncbi:hypothetical protein OROHE_021887 [Orobanche hederae]